LKETDSIIAFVNQYAPEHLIIASDEPQQFVDGIVNAGSVFIGNYTPESAGDYASGTNHTLPTNGFAKSYSGVSVDSFVKKITYQQISRNGISKLGNTIIIMAEAEGLDAHANAVKIRLNKI
jgi:histidinol dehydrogenase